LSVRSPSDIVKRWYNSYASQKDLANRKLPDAHGFSNFLIRKFGNEVNAACRSKNRNQQKIKA
jgi:hypothetical protein